MTAFAVILMPDAPSAPVCIGGLPLVTRHIKELHKLGVRKFYLCGVTQVPLAIRRSRLPVDAMLYAMPCTQNDIPRRLQNLPVVLLTAVSDGPLIADAARLGVQDFILKGAVSGLSLLERVAKSLRHAPIQ